MDISEIIGDKKSNFNNLNMNPSAISPFWPSINFWSKEKNCICIRPVHNKEDLHTNIQFSKPFWYNYKHSTVLTFKNNVNFR